MRGNHSDSEKKHKFKNPLLTIPFNAPGFLLNKYTMNTFNTLYFKRPIKLNRSTDYEPFFYPLDKILKWNRLYGKQGFMQFQCVIPNEFREIAMQEMLLTIANSQQASFLSVLKQFGNIKSPGLLSFPRQGTTLALDFPNKGLATLDLFKKLEAITLQYCGAVYPAEDALMSSEAFAQYFPNWKQFSSYIDLHFSSDFWRRVLPNKST